MPQQPNQPQSQPGQSQPRNPPGKPQERPHSPDVGREQKNQPGRSGQDAPRTEPSKSAPGRTSSPRQQSDEEAQRDEENEGPAGLTTKSPSQQQPRRQGEERFRPNLPGYSDPGDPRRLEVEGQKPKDKK